MRRTVTAAGLPAHVTTRDLRRICASVLITQGQSVNVAQSRLGHRSAVQTLDTCGHLWPAPRRKIGSRRQRISRGDELSWATVPGLASAAGAIGAAVSTRTYVQLTRSLVDATRQSVEQNQVLIDNDRRRWEIEQKQRESERCGGRRGPSHRASTTTQSACGPPQSARDGSPPPLHSPRHRARGASACAIGAQDRMGPRASAGRSATVSVDCSPSAAGPTGSPPPSSCRCTAPEVLPVTRRKAAENALALRWPTCGATWQGAVPSASSTIARRTRACARQSPNVSPVSSTNRRASVRRAVAEAGVPGGERVAVGRVGEQRVGQGGGDGVDGV